MIGDRKVRYPFIGKRDDVVALFYKGVRDILVSIYTGDSQDFFTGDDCDKSLDPETFTDITAEYLRNTKIKVLSPEHSEMIQQLVFDADGKWASGVNDQPMYTRSEYLVIDNELELYTCSPGYFCSSGSKEITLPLPPKQEDGGDSSLDNSRRVNAAIATLERMSYTYHGGELWKPPIGKCPESIANPPTYTHEMQERGDFKIGMKYLNSDGQLCEMVGFTGEMWHGKLLEQVVLDGYLESSYCAECRPLPTPEEKLRDKLIDVMDNSSTAFTYAEHIAKAIIKGEIDGVNWEGEQ